MWLATAVAAPAAEGLEPRFVPSQQCIACHSNMVTDDGNGLSIGHAWRATMMALSAKDPYWQAGVRREIADHPQLRETIEDTCSICHMPMFRTRSKAAGGSGEIVRYLEGGFSPEERKLGADGVSCTVCHQIAAAELGEHATFDGGYVIEPSLPEEIAVFGPHEVEPGLERVMHSASAALPARGDHVQSSELCATCHTLFTPAMDSDGNVVGEFPEQVPYLEWLQSAYAETESCQDCHMPEAGGAEPIGSVLGEPRPAVSRHAFRGGNAFMLRMLDRYREELGVTTPAADLEAAAAATLQHLQTRAAEIEIDEIRRKGPEAIIDVTVRNLAGHKLPTAYPSRRAWLHLTVRDGNGRTIFESGALADDGSITGNDNDADPAAYEPHYVEISDPEQVQIYEPIIRDHGGAVTTSLLSAATLAKDNRLLPRGFDPAAAAEAVRVHGAATQDPDFAGGGDRLRYRVTLPDGSDSVEVSAELLYQTIGHRWARNLESYDAPEARRFVGYYRENAADSAVVLATARLRSDAVHTAP
jgi:hypothetical protein